AMRVLTKALGLLMLQGSAGCLGERANLVHYDYYTLSDDSLAEEQAEMHMTLFCAVCYIPFFCISMPGNSFLLGVLLRERCWKTTPDILLLQLTVSALCFPVTLPFWAYNLLHGWVFGNLACGITGGATFLGQHSCVVIITVMTLYHYVAVDHASCLSAQASKKFLLVASIMIWLICAAVSIRFSMNFVVEDSGSDHISCSYYPHSHSVLIFYISVHSGLFFLIPFIIITFCYAYRATKQCKINRQHQASRFILGITVGLFLCLAPYNIALIIEYLHLLVHSGNPVSLIPRYLVYIIITLPYFHCCLNLFHIYGQRFRRYLCMYACDTSPQRRDRGQDFMPLNDTSV
uniref:G-protein coupled receptors family 1 profile domain-containing protein n=1 Tax=Seriola lalandi dorsalis TaxID=1841481 RepID=A0A3B4XUQ5_SERLL